MNKISVRESYTEVSKKKNVRNKKLNANKKTISAFRDWCKKNGVTQEDIHKKTHLSIGCIHMLWRDRKASKSTILLISLVYNIKEDELTKMIKTSLKTGKNYHK